MANDKYDRKSKEMLSEDTMGAQDNLENNQQPQDSTREKDEERDTMGRDES
jgi:hypothetical protein